MDIRIHPSCKQFKKVISQFMGENPALQRATNGFALSMGPASDPHFATPPHAQDAIYVGDAAFLDGYRATAELAAMFKKNPNSVSMVPKYNSQTRKWTYDVLKGAMDAAVNPLVGQTYSPWNVSFFQKVFKEPLLYSHARKLVSIEQGTNPWAELMSLALEQYAGFAIAAGTGSPQNNMVNDVNVRSGLMTAPVINLSVSYTLTIEELERSRNNDNPFAGQAMTRKQSYANYVIDMLTDYIIYYGNAETETQGLLNVNAIEAWPGDSLADIAAGASTTKGADAYKAVFTKINSFLNASDNKFNKIKVSMAPAAYNLLTSLPYSDSFSPVSAKKIFEDNYMGGENKDGKTPDIEFISDPMLKANSIFNTTAQDYLVITAPEIEAGPDNEKQAMLPLGAPLMDFVFPAVPGQYNTQYKTLRRVAGVFAPVPIAVKVYSDSGYNMTKYIVGYTSYSYSVLGVEIPKKSSNRTAADIAEVSEAQLERLKGNKLFQQLLDTEAIKVLDVKPSWATSVSERLSNLQEENAQLKRGGNKLFREAKVAWATEKQTLLDEFAKSEAAWATEKQGIIDEATKVIGEKDAEIARLQALIPAKE